MSIVVKKVTEKNTKKQILEEYEKAIKLIDELKATLKKSNSVQPTIVKPTSTKEIVKRRQGVSVDILIDTFNTFSNNLKEDMNAEIKIIDELKKKINKKIDSIHNIYSTDSNVSLDELIQSYNSIIKEQEIDISNKKQNNLMEIDKIKNNFEKERVEHIENFAKKQDSFKLNSTRTEKEDIYLKNKTINILKKEREELVENNKSIIDDLQYEHKKINREAYRELEEEQKEQSETITKAKTQKDKFEQTINNKVTSVITKEKLSNTQELKSMQEEYENKIKLKTTQLNNFKHEESSLDIQIEELLNELNAIQEKAHILASKTIDAQSSTQSFQAMKDVAMEQARSKK